MTGDTPQPQNLKKYQAALLRLGKIRISDSQSLDDGFRYVCEILGDILEVGRASIWTYNQGKTAIECRNLFEKSKNAHSSGLALKAKDFPKYFKYLSESRTLPANDAETDPATSEFKDIYLKPLGITSMLDAPIRINGEVVGVICNEQVGPKRQWTEGEQFFAGVVADQVAMLFETYQFLEAQRQIENEKLVAMRNAKLASIGEMAGGIAHEINNPLQVILSRAEMLENLLVEGSADKQTLIDQARSISRTADRITRIVRGLKMLARDGSADAVEEFDLKSLIEDSTSYCSEKLRQHGIKLETNMLAEPLPIVGNSVGISQVLVNLLNNAFDAVMDRAERWVKLEVKRSPGKVNIVVTDSGPGIPEALRTKIMQPFFTTKPAGKGTGLGLSLSRDIIASHGGKLTIDPTNKNTSFVVELPTEKKAA